MLLWTWVREYLFETLLSFLLGTYPTVEMRGHRVIQFSVFWETTAVFSIVAASLLYHATKSAQRFPLLHTLVSTCYFLPFFFFFFDSGHPHAREAVSHCGFDLRLPSDQGCWSSSHVLISHLHIFSGETSTWVPCPFLVGVAFLGVLYIFWTITPHQIYDLQIFSPIP